MNNNGFIRKIDELGRIVIPKEVRNKLKLQDNENIFINYDDTKAYIQKYSYILNNRNYINNFGNIVSEILKIPIIIYDREKIVYSNEMDETNLKSAEGDIIINSILIGKIVLKYGNNSEMYEKTCKMLANILALSLYNS